MLDKNLHKLMQGVLHPAAEGAILALLVVHLASHGLTTEFLFAFSILFYGCLLYLANEDTDVRVHFGWPQFWGDLFAVCLRILAGSTLLSVDATWVKAIGKLLGLQDATWLVASLALLPMPLYHAWLNHKRRFRGVFIRLNAWRVLVLVAGCVLAIAWPQRLVAELLLASTFLGVTILYGRQLIREVTVEPDGHSS